MRIGIPKEILHDERRVAATPETVKELTKLGFHVTVEAGAGAGIYVADDMYRAAGATVEQDASAVFGGADLVLKVKQPILNVALGKHEVELLGPGKVLITFLHPAAPSSHDMVKLLRERNITAFTMDGIPRVSRAQGMDALTSMSTITGYKSVIMAASRLPTFVPMTTTAIGTLKPAKVLVVGIGVVGLQALATAKRLGAVSSAVDIQPEARKAATSLGVKVAGFEVPEELAKGKGGYAKALPPDYLKKEQEALGSLLPETDIVILSALVPGEQAPILLTAEMVERMRPGSVIVDVSIDQGGNCALTTPGAEVVHRGVTICGLQNIPGSMPVHATYLYSNNMLQYVQNMYKRGPGQIDWDDEVVQASLVTRNGEIVHHGTRKALGLP